jgi:hypothetical protein
MQMLKRSCQAGQFEVLIPLDRSRRVLREALADDDGELLEPGG